MALWCHLYDIQPDFEKTILIKGRGLVYAFGAFGALFGLPTLYRMRKTRQFSRFVVLAKAGIHAMLHEWLGSPIELGMTRRE
ncbi:MAG: hypothetical protein SH809_05105 [Rhodothermales bacterium]|nr:hypothetical protein [Rhodothermales bacterium]